MQSNSNRLIRKVESEKTTTSINLGVGLARMGQRVLLVDADPQGHLTLGLGISEKYPGDIEEHDGKYHHGDRV